MILLTAEQAAREVWRRRSTIRYWVFKGTLSPVATLPDGTQLFRLEDVFAAERTARRAKRGRPRRHAA